jgi:hypothetical protein
MRKLTRRLFIAAAAATGAAVIGTGGKWWYGESPTAYARGLILERLPYLKLAPGTLDAFVKDIAEYERPSGNQRFATLFGLHLAHGLTRLMGAGFRQKLDYYETQLVTLFLMSTDFFPNGEDIAKPVQYLALADPYVAACSNPIAVLAE